MARTRLTREESDRCKLSDDDIESIIRMREKWMTYANIAKLFPVSYPTVYYYCNPEKKYEQNKNKWEKRKEEWYYNDKEKYNKLLSAIKKTRIKKRNIIPWYAQWEDKESNTRYIRRLLEKKEQLENNN